VTKNNRKYRFTQNDRYKVIPFSETLEKLDLADNNDMDSVAMMPYEIFFGNAKHERKEEREKNMPWLKRGKRRKFFR
jgi:hypothetical protein